VVAVREAATVVLVRDRPALEVLMLRRTPHAVFSPGASVFPGGAVDAGDGSATVVQRITGGDDAAVSAEMSLASGGLAVKVAAVRECFEEAGLLLAHTPGTGDLVDVSEPSRRHQLAQLRHELNAGTATWEHVLERADVTLDLRDLHLFAHWRTPIGAPRRYDTWFFVAAAPDGGDGVHDDNEVVASEWIAPAAALEQFRDGDIDLIFPTMRTLTVLSHFDTARDAIDALAAVPRDELDRPAVVYDGGGERVALERDREADAAGTAFGFTVPLPDLDRRALAREGVA
jgi:8-oxo-dGTP pyrophosphatase MutT (NUDIX family)